MGFYRDIFRVVSLTRLQPVSLVVADTDAGQEEARNLRDLILEFCPSATCELVTLRPGRFQEIPEADLVLINLCAEPDSEVLKTAPLDQYLAEIGRKLRVERPQAKIASISPYELTLEMELGFTPAFRKKEWLLDATMETMVEFIAFLILALRPFSLVSHRPALPP